MSAAVKVASREPRSIANGPGERFVVWVQGCPFRCPGCYNPAFLPFEGGEEMTVDALESEILRVRGIDGVTFSGGEPMAQAAALAALSERLRMRGLSVICFTGYTHEALLRMNDPAIGAFLREIDLLIDGPYVERWRTNLRWRGSSNQRLLRLTTRFDQVESDERNTVELIVGREGFRTTGIFDPEIARRLEEHLDGHA